MRSEDRGAFLEEWMSIEGRCARPSWRGLGSSTHIAAAELLQPATGVSLDSSALQRLDQPVGLRIRSGSLTSASFSRERQSARAAVRDVQRCVLLVVSLAGGDDVPCFAFGVERTLDQRARR